MTEPSTESTGAEPLYLLTLTGVYDHGPCGLFTEKGDAEEHAKYLHARSDGYHDFRIDEIVPNRPIFEGLPLNVGGYRSRTHHPLRLTHEVHQYVHANGEPCNDGVICHEFSRCPGCP